jgi:hypothetical protein
VEFETGEAKSAFDSVDSVRIVENFLLLYKRQEVFQIISRVFSCSETSSLENILFHKLAKSLPGFVLFLLLI